MDLEKYIENIKQQNIAVDSVFVSENNRLQKCVLN